MPFALNYQDISATSLRQVISHARSDNAAADDDYVCSFHKTKVKRKRGKVKCVGSSERRACRSTAQRLSNNAQGQPHSGYPGYSVKEYRSNPDRVAYEANQKRREP